MRNQQENIMAEYATASRDNDHKTVPNGVIVQRRKQTKQFEDNRPLQLRSFGVAQLQSDGDLHRPLQVAGEGCNTGPRQVRDSRVGPVIGVTRSYPKSLEGKQTIMRKFAGKAVKRPHASINWAHDWRKYLGRGGTDSNDYGRNANLSLRGHGVSAIPDMMSAHLVPKRLGGKGVAANMVPWPKFFEDYNWKYKMEDPFDAKVQDLTIGEEIGYAVNTVPIGSDSATKFVERNMRAGESVGNKRTIVGRIEEIPKKVMGYIDGRVVINHEFTDDWWNADHRDLLIGK